MQQILNNLCISHIELRSEDSPDIKPYIHERVVEKIVLPLGDDLCQLKAKYCRVSRVIILDIFLAVFMFLWIFFTSVLLYCYWNTCINISLIFYFSLYNNVSV